MLSDLKSVLRPEIPFSAKVFGWILVAAGCFFAFIYMATPGTFFPGVGITSYSEQFGLYSTGVRVLGSVFGLIIALLLNSTALLAIMLATRAFIEVGDVLVGLVINKGSADANTFILLVLAGIEIYFVVTLTRRLMKTVSKA